MVEVNAVTAGRQPYRNMLLAPRVIGYKKHPILQAEWQYYDVAIAAAPKGG